MTEHTVSIQGKYNSNMISWYSLGSNLSLHKKTITKRARKASVASLLMTVAAVSVIASLASTGMIQANNAAAAGNTIYKEKFSGLEFSAESKLQEGDTETYVFIAASRSVEGGDWFTLMFDRVGPDQALRFFVEGPPDRLSIDEGLNSATLSAPSVTGVDEETGTEMTISVDVSLTATGKAQISKFSYHVTTPDYRVVENLNGIHKLASGSVNIIGDLSFSTKDATGQIGKVRAGSIEVDKV